MQIISISIQIFKTIINLPSYEPQDFYSAELIEDTFYIPIQTRGLIYTFNINTRNTSNIVLPIGAYPDIFFYSKIYGLFIGLASLLVECKA